MRAAVQIMQVYRGARIGLNVVYTIITAFTSRSTRL
jgi:hypothetical protein